MKNNITILYVEDNDLVRDEAVEYLSLLYHNVLKASNGEEALTIYNESKPDIIITDIEMPIMSGLQLIKAIRRRDKEIPIIVMTAFLNTEYLLEAVELQLVKYVVKPLSNYKLDMALELAHEYLVNEEKKCIVELSNNAFYDQFNRTLIVNKKNVALTHNEMLLLGLLSKNINTLVVYEEIKNRIWNYETSYMDALRSLVRSLRNKVGSDVTIKNVSGMGYRLIFTEES